MLGGGVRGLLEFFLWLSTFSVGAQVGGLLEFLLVSIDVIIYMHQLLF